MNSLLLVSHTSGNTTNTRCRLPGRLPVVLDDVTVSRYWGVRYDSITRMSLLLNTNRRHHMHDCCLGRALCWEEEPGVPVVDHQGLEVEGGRGGGEYEGITLEEYDSESVEVHTAAAAAAEEEEDDDVVPVKVVQCNGRRVEVLDILRGAVYGGRGRRR